MRSDLNSCKCCLRNRHVLQDLWGVNLVEGDTWAYGELITICFALTWQKPVDRTELICDSCIKILLIAFKFKRDVLASEQILLEQLEDEDIECKEIIKEEDMKDNNIIQEDLITDEDRGDKVVSDNLEHFEETVNEDSMDGQEYSEVHSEDNINVESVQKAIDQTELSQQQENIHENLNCTAKEIENCLKAVSSNKLVPIVALDRYIPKKTEQLKQRKTKATDVLQNREVIKTECGSHLTRTHEDKEEPKEATSDSISSTLSEKKDLKIIDYKLQRFPSQPELISERISARSIANKRDNTQRTLQYSAEDLQSCLNAIKSERLTVVAASALYSIPISTINPILNKYNDKPNVTPIDADSLVLKYPSTCGLCELCGQDLPTSSSVTQHKCKRALITSSCNIEERGEQAATKFTCDICKEDFESKSSLTQHILHIHKYSKKNNIKFTCNICNKQFTQRSTLIVHQRIHSGEKPYSCEICNRKFTQNSTLNTHRRIHTGDKPYSCKFCNKQFLDSSSRTKHERVHSGDKPYSCNICNKHFPLNSSLTSHKRIHTTDKPYSCQICNKQFLHSSSLVTHQRIHTGEKPYSCKICNKQFSDNSTLIAHRRIHTGEKPYSCNICNKQFSKSSSRAKHQRVHTGEKPYSCKLCNKNFAEKGQLNNHQSVHSSDTPYPCKICYKQFKNKSALTKHQRIHTGERPYSCKICNKKFTQSSHLSGHKRIHSRDEPTA